jgi:hypothetical protein
MFMDAVTIGVVFARISHPKYRGRTIGISDSAIISRRDGILKFMFRVADFRWGSIGHSRTPCEGVPHVLVNLIAY